MYLISSWHVVWLFSLHFSSSSFLSCARTSVNSLFSSPLLCYLVSLFSVSLCFCLSFSLFLSVSPYLSSFLQVSRSDVRLVRQWAAHKESVRDIQLIQDPPSIASCSFDRKVCHSYISCLSWKCNTAPTDHLINN